MKAECTIETYDYSSNVVVNGKDQTVANSFVAAIRSVECRMMPNQLINTIVRRVCSVTDLDAEIIAEIRRTVLDKIQFKEIFNYVSGTSIGAADQLRTIEITHSAIYTILTSIALYCTGGKIAMNEIDSFVDKAFEKVWDCF